MFTRAPLLAEKATAWYFLDKIEPKGFGKRYSQFYGGWGGGDLNLEYEEVASSIHTSNVWKVLESDSDGKCEGHVNKKQGDKAEEIRLIISKILTYFIVIFNF